MTPYKPSTVRDLLSALEDYQRLVQRRGGHVAMRPEVLEQLTPEERELLERLREGTPPKIDEPTKH